jgi:hypothetical protein
MGVVFGGTIILWALFRLGATTPIISYLSVAGIAAAFVDNKRRT